MHNSTDTIYNCGKNIKAFVIDLMGENGIFLEPSATYCLFLKGILGTILRSKFKKSASASESRTQRALLL